MESGWRGRKEKCGVGFKLLTWCCILRNYSLVETSIGPQLKGMKHSRQPQQDMAGDGNFRPTLQRHVSFLRLIITPYLFRCSVLRIRRSFLSNSFEKATVCSVLRSKLGARLWSVWSLPSMVSPLWRPLSHPCVPWNLSWLDHDDVTLSIRKNIAPCE